MTIYDELVASSSQLYGSEKAVETEQQMQKMREEQSKFTYGMKERELERRNQGRSRMASLLGLLSRGYKEFQENRLLEKRGQEMIDKGFVKKKWWDIAKPEEKNMFWYDYLNKNVADRFTNITPKIDYGYKDMTDIPMYEKEQFYSGD